jgi:hypothetical protein
MRKVVLRYQYQKQKINTIRDEVPARFIIELHLKDIDLLLKNTIFFLLPPLAPR